MSSSILAHVLLLLLILLLLLPLLLPIVTSGQSNLPLGRIAAAHGRFNCIRQVAPMCTPRLVHLAAIRTVTVLLLLSRFGGISTAGHVK